MRVFILPFALVASLVLFLSACATTGSEQAVITQRPAQTTENINESTASAVALEETWQDTVTVGRFDTGRMWTFDNLPFDYFREVYGLEMPGQWQELAQRGALRFGENCSASFVSPNGLVMTNHHCSRESISDVSREGESLLDDGFYASALDEERRVEDLFVDQLVDIQDVTRRVESGIPDYQNDEEEADSRRRRIENVQDVMTRTAKEQDSTLHVQVVGMYSGARYTAYTYKRYDDVRIVMAPEVRMGHYGGDADNFTFPRYALDMAFFRVYQDSVPLASSHYFRWSSEGAREGQPVFVVGSPGSTNRHKSVSQLEFTRDYEIPQQLSVLNRREKILRDFMERSPMAADSFELRNRYASIANTIKLLKGQLKGLEDPYLLARKKAAEWAFQDSLGKDDELEGQYGRLNEELNSVQQSKRATARRSGAFTYFGTTIGSSVLTRSLYGYVYALQKRRGAPPNVLENLLEGAREIEDLPPEVEVAYIQARLEELNQYLGQSDPTVRRMLDGKSPAEFAQLLVDSTALVDSTGFFRLIEEGYLASTDQSVQVVNAIGPLFFTLGTQNNSFADREENLAAKLAQARYSIDGTTKPPDATFTLRLSDGVVKSYAYNGTQAPAYTTFYGLYSHHFSYGRMSDWGLPARWLDPPTTFNFATPLNIVTTNDITGGNSGSPLLNANLEIVGLVFDGNIESLPNDFLFRDAAARAIAVDSRGMLEALDEIYDADRVVVELTSGNLVATEADADALEGE